MLCEQQQVKSTIAYRGNSYLTYIKRHFFSWQKALSQKKHCLQSISNSKSTMKCSYATELALSVLENRTVSTTRPQCISIYLNASQCISIYLNKSQFSLNSRWLACVSVYCMQCRFTVWQCNVLVKCSSAILWCRAMYCILLDTVLDYACMCSTSAHCSAFWCVVSSALRIAHFALCIAQPQVTCLAFGAMQCIRASVLCIYVFVVYLVWCTALCICICVFVYLL